MPHADCSLESFFALQEREEKEVLFAKDFVPGLPSSLGLNVATLASHWKEAEHNGRKDKFLENHLN